MNCFVYIPYTKRTHLHVAVNGVFCGFLSLKRQQFAYDSGSLALYLVEFDTFAAGQNRRCGQPHKGRVYGINKFLVYNLGSVQHAVTGRAGHPGLTMHD